MKKLYFYEWDGKEHTLKDATAEVNETEKTYVLPKDTVKESLPFLYKSKLLKSELNSVISWYTSRFVCVMEAPDPAKAREIIGRYLDNKISEANVELARWSGYTHGVR